MRRDLSHTPPPSYWLFYGSETVSDDSRFEHCAVGVPEILAVPVILESESQNRSTAFPLIVERGVLLMDKSILELLIATRPPRVPFATVALNRVACELFIATIP